jgi:hypothetical protein
VVFAPSPLTVFEVELEGSAGSIELCEAAFDEAPEALDAVDMHLAVREGIADLAVLFDAQVLFIAIVDQTRLTAPAIGDDSGIARDVTPDKSL